MPYYATLEEDLTRAKEILAKGMDRPPEDMAQLFTGGGTIYGADIHAAYRLLESFVEELERRRPATGGTPPLREFRYAHGRLDDVVMEKVELLHLEQMDTHYWWMGLYTVTGDGFILHINGTEKGIRVEVETE